MPIPWTEDQQNDYLMSKSVMDAERSPYAKIKDFAFGRTLPEQTTNAFTGGLGVVVPTDPLSKAMWYIAKRRMEPEIVNLLEKSDFVTKLVALKGKLQSSGNPGLYLSGRRVQGSPPQYPGAAVVNIGSSIKDVGNPFSVVGHEMTHAAQDVAGQYRTRFPGLTTPNESVGISAPRVMEPGEYLPYKVMSDYPMTNLSPEQRVNISNPEAFYAALKEWFKASRSVK